MILLRQYLLVWSICNFHYSTVSDHKNGLCHIVPSNKSITTICQKVKTIVPQLDSIVLPWWTQRSESYFFNELTKVTCLGRPEKHSDLSTLFFQCSSTHFWIVINIKSKDGDPLIGHLLLPSYREVGTGRGTCPQPAYHSPSHSHATAPCLSPTAPRQAEASVVLTNIYPNRYILIETNGS